MTIDRINPGFFSGRWYHLIKLRRGTAYAIDKFIKGQKREIILDFGCGDSPYKPMFAPFVNKYIGADIARNENAEILINVDNGAVDAPDGFCDVLLSTQVLEHVTDPVAYLLEAKRLLKPDGLMILSTHGHWVYHPDPTDFWRWTRDGLEKTIMAAGFEVVEIIGIGGQAVAGLQIFQESLRHRFPGPFKKAWFGFIGSLQFILDRDRYDTRDACVYLVIATKKPS